MKAHEILRLLVRRFWLLLLLTAIGGGLGAAYAALETPTYTAKAYVVATAEAGDPISALNFAQAYGRVATSGPVLARAGELLGSDRAGLDSVTASTSPDAPVVEIGATGPSAQHTADVANAVATALTAYGTDRKAATHVGLALLAGATTPAAPSSPRPPLEIVVGVAGGLLIGGLAVLAGAGRPRERAGDDGEESARTAELPRPVFGTPAPTEEEPGARRALGAPRDAVVTPAAASAARVPSARVPSAGVSPADTSPIGLPLAGGPSGTGDAPAEASPGVRPAGRTPAGESRGGESRGGESPGGVSPGGAFPVGDGDGATRELQPVSGGPAFGKRAAEGGTDAGPGNGGAAGGAEAEPFGGTKAINGKVFSPGTAVGRAAVSGTEDGDD